MWKNTLEDKKNYYILIKDPVQRHYIMNLDESFRAKERLSFREGGDHEYRPKEKKIGRYN